MINPMDDLIKNGPWPVQALCLDCGDEYPGTAITHVGFIRLERVLTPHGTCVACIAKSDVRLAELTKRDAKEEAIPNRKDVRKRYESDHKDPFDPFDGRKDLF